MTSSGLAIAAAGTATTSTGSSGISHLSGGDRALSLALIVGFVLLAGAVVILGRRVLEGPPPQASKTAGAPGGSVTPGGTPDSTLVRSWVAISLVGGLLIFVTLSFWLDDTQLRNVLIGGVVANAGAAIAFYFASKSSDQARKDILAAALPSTLVPNLVGKDLPGAHEAIASTPLRLEVHPATPGAGAQVVTQTPTANQSAPSGSPVAATFAGPVPDLTGLSLDQARSKLAAVGLQLEPSPAQPASSAVVTHQDPLPAAAPTGLKVQATFESPQ